MLPFEAEDVGHLVEPCEAGSLVLGRFVALHLLGLHPEARGQVLLIQAFRNPGPDERVRDAREAGVCLLYTSDAADE